MKIISKLIFIILICWAWISLSRTFYFCYLGGNCIGSVNELKIPTLQNTLSVYADGLVVLDSFPEFYFYKGKSEIPNKQDYSLLLEQISTHLKMQPNSRLLIRGFYNNSEIQQPGFDLGLSRANSLSELIAKEHNVNPQFIYCESVLNEDSITKFIGLEFLGHIPKSEFLIPREDSLFRLQWKDSLNYVRYSGLLGIFEPDVETFNASNAFSEYVDSLKLFLKKNPKLIVEITGHSDTHTSEEEAKKIALHYADNCAVFLKKHGVKNKMIIESMGKAKPLYNDFLPDKSPDILNIAKNRRIEIRVISKSQRRKKVKSN